MSETIDPASAEIAALCTALASAPGDGKRVLAERLFNLLEDSRPAAARIAASLLAAVGDASGSSLGKEILPQLNTDPAADFLRERQLTPSLSPDSAETISDVDVLILCIKSIELSACLRAFAVQLPATPERLYGGAEAFFVEDQGTQYAIASVGVDGNVESALKFGRLVQGLRFKLAVLVGMAAGVKGEVQLGDVVVSEQVWAVDFEIVRPTGSVPRPKTYAPRSSLYADLESMVRVVDTDWPDRVYAEIVERASQRGIDQELPPNYTRLRRRPRVKAGVIFAGSRLIEDSRLVRERDSSHGRLLAAEMEGAGFAAAASELEASNWLVVRGISDFGDIERAKRWQFAATYAGAALVRDAMAKGRIHLSK